MFLVFLVDFLYFFVNFEKNFPDYRMSHIQSSIIFFRNPHLKKNTFSLMQKAFVNFGKCAYLGCAHYEWVQ